MAKRYRNHRVPDNFDSFIKDFSYRNKINKRIDIYRQLVKEQEKTDEFLRSIFGNKKGSAGIDVGTGTIFVLIVLVFLFTAGLIFVVFGDNFSAYSGTGASYIADVVSNGYKAVTGYDIAGIIVVVGFMVFLFSLAFFYESAPFFFTLFLAISFIMMLVSIPVVNGVADYVNGTNALVQETASRMPATLFFINNWIYVIIAYTCAAIIGFGARPNKEDGGL